MWCSKGNYGTVMHVTLCTVFSCCSNDQLFPFSVQARLSLGQIQEAGHKKPTLNVTQNVNIKGKNTQLSHHDSNLGLEYLPTFSPFWLHTSRPFLLKALCSIDILRTQDRRVQPLGVWSFPAGLRGGAPRDPYRQLDSFCWTNGNNADLEHKQLGHRCHL